MARQPLTTSGTGTFRCTQCSYENNAKGKKDQKTARIPCHSDECGGDVTLQNQRGY